MKNNQTEAFEWVAMGDEDLRVAKLLIENEESTRIIGFHCQQAAEKYFKALLSYHQIKIPFSHDLPKLYNLCIQADSGISFDIGYLVDLSKFAVEIRYSKNPQIDEEALYSGYNYVQTIRNTILSKITEE